MKLVLERGAQEDLIEAATWFNEQEEHLGEVFLERIEPKLSLVVEFPFIAPVVHGEIRYTTVAPYRYSIYYLVDEELEQVVVMAVDHDSRDPEGREARLEKRLGG